MALLIVASVGAWPTSSLASLNSVNKMNLSRFFEAPWLAQEMADWCITYMLGQSVPHCRPTKMSSSIPDDTSCEYVGSHLSLWIGTTLYRYPWAHKLVTSFYLGDAVRFPVDARLYRCYDESTQWGA
jgi:hypothetical protein